MDNDLQAIVNFYERDRGVGREQIIRAIELALEKVFGNAFKCPGYVRVAIDRRKLLVKAFRKFKVNDSEMGPAFIATAQARKVRPDAVPGMEFEVEIPAGSLGRIGIQTARQTILGKLREAERETVIENYQAKIGEIVTGHVKSVTSRRGDVIVSLEKAEAIIHRRDCLPTDHFNEGDIVRALITNVVPLQEAIQTSSPPVVLSRSNSAFLRQLFVLEVAEINEGTVEIMGIARDPGSRAKVAVRSFDPNIDPIGACVGTKGRRVSAIVNELGGEKIDIVRWNEDVCRFAEQALAPAKLLSVTLSPDDPKKILVTVSEDQLSLAIGRGGQNVRLATKLVGFSISITKRDDGLSFEAMLEKAVASLMEAGISEADARTLAAAGYTSLDGIAEENPEGLAEATGLGEALSAEIIGKAAVATGR